MSDIERIAGENMRFECWALADMIPATYNPRKALTPSDPEYQDIARSIENLDYSQPIILNYDGTIIAGHQRRTVMMDLGYTAAMVVVLEIRDKNKEKALNIALNKIDGKWDQAVLKDLLLELDLNGYDFSITGFHQDELEDLIQALDVPAEANDDDFDPDEARERIEAPVTNRGDIWQLGRHRLMCGDATDPEDVAALMRGELLDLVITDPPYNVDYGSKVNGVPGYFKNKDRGDFDYIQADSMDTLSFYQFLLAAFQNMNDAMMAARADFIRMERGRCPLLHQRQDPGHGHAGGDARFQEHEAPGVAGLYRKALPGQPGSNLGPLRKQAQPEQPAPDHEADPAGRAADEQLQQTRMGGR